RAPAEELSAKLELSYRQQRSTFGVCCFGAGDPRDVLMWSHYGGENTGICLQFEDAKNVVTLSRALSVDYVDEYPILNWITGFRDAIGKTLLRKHSRWKYEGEHRIHVEGQAGK